MIVWVLWEDQRAENTRDFGPQVLLVSCLLDDKGAGLERGFIAERVRANPRKGDGKVLAALKRNLKQFLDDGSVFAVFDRDRAHLMWGVTNQPPRCRTALRERIRNDAPGPPYEVVFLEQNMETLVAACCKALGREPFKSKPTPLERDAILKTAARSSPELRAKILKEVPSFERLVVKVGNVIAPWALGSAKLG